MKISILGEYFQQRIVDIEALSSSRALHAYYQNKSLGMSLEYGLAVALAEMRAEFERFQGNALLKKRPVFEEIAFVDAREMRVIAATKPFSELKLMDTNYLESALQRSERVPVFEVSRTDSVLGVVVVRAYSYKDKVTGYLLMKLDLGTLWDQIEHDVPQNNDFDGIVDPSGILLMGPPKLVGKNVGKVTGVGGLPSALGETGVIESHDHLPALGGESLLISGGNIPYTTFTFLNVVPSSRYLAGYSPFLWVLVFSGLVVGIVIIVVILFRSALVQVRMFRQLEEARDTLDTRVRERTAELAETNQHLKAEISERKRTAQALEESEKKYRELIDNAIESIVVANEGKFKFVNPNTLELFGFSIQDLTSRPFEFFVYPEDREIAAKCYLETIDAEGENRSCEFRILNSSGIPKWVYVNAVGIKWDGKPSALGFLTDVTERKRAMEVVRRSEEKYRSLVDNAPIGIILIDTKGQILEVNRALLDILGSPSAEDTKSINLFSFPTLVAAGIPEIFSRCIETGQVATAEFPYRSKWGRPSHLRIVSTPLRDPSSMVYGCQAVVEDVTEQKRAQELLLETERIKGVADLAGGVAHNFNNLLQVVMGRAQLALNDLKNRYTERINSHLQQIVETSRMGADTVKRLQNFSRLRSDQALVVGKVFDLSHTVEHALAMTEPWWKSKPARDGIRIVVSKNIKIGCLLNGKENEIFEVIVNLIKNAVEAMPTGGDMDIRVSEKGEEVILQVQDSGTGISQSDLKRIFDPFWTSKGPGGTGMGLASSKGIVTDHGGEMSVISSLGCGSTFTITFPRANGLIEWAANNPNIQSFLHLKVLVIDDSEQIVDFLQQTLEEHCSTVLTATSGPEGIELFKRNPVDVVICDLGMTEINGIAVSSEIQAICRERSIRKPVFLLLTGWADQIAEEQNLFESGIDRVLGKPVTINELTHVLRELAIQK